jgi:hypothetical protein
VPCTALQTLDLSQNPDVTVAGLQATLPALQQLQQLNLEGTGVDDGVLILLGQLPKLQHLVLADTAVTWEWDAGIDSTAVVQQQGQEGSSRHSSGAVSASTKQLWQKLRVLDLSSTHLTDAGCQQLARQLAPAAAAEAATASQHGGVVPASSGLTQLVIGSSSSSRAKLGKQGLAQVARISSLQQLTLQVRSWCVCTSLASLIEHSSAGLLQTLLMCSCGIQWQLNRSSLVSHRCTCNLDG